MSLSVRKEASITQAQQKFVATTNLEQPREIQTVNQDDDSDDGILDIEHLLTFDSGVTERTQLLPNYWLALVYTTLAIERFSKKIFN